MIDKKYWPFHDIQFFLEELVYIKFSYFELSTESRKI